MVAGPLIEPAGRHDPGVFAAEVALLRLRDGGLIPGMILIHGIAQRILLHKLFAIFPAVVVRAAEKDANVKVDVHQVGGYELVVHDDAGRDVHRAAPLGHFLVGIIADCWIVKRAPAGQQDAPLAYFFVSGKRFVEEIEEVVVQRNDLLHEFHVLHQAHQVIREELNGRNGAYAAGIERGRMHVAALPSGRTFRASCGSSAALRGRTIRRRDSAPS